MSTLHRPMCQLNLGDRKPYLRDLRLRLRTFSQVCLMIDIMLN
jgi:hypothetical protein